MSLHGRKNFLGVTFYFDLRKHLLDVAVGTNHKSRPLDAHVLLAIHTLFFPGPVGFRSLVVHIGEQGERQVEFVLKLGLCLRSIRRDAYDNGVCRGEFL